MSLGVAVHAYFLLPCVAFSMRSGCIVNRPNASQEFEEYAERRNQVSAAL